MFPMEQIITIQDRIKYLNTSMRAKVKVKFSWMTDSHVNGRTGRNIATLANFIITISTEKSKNIGVISSSIKTTNLLQIRFFLPCMMAFLNNNEGYAGLIGTL